MNIHTLLDSVKSLSQVVGTVIPGAGLISKGVEIGEKVLGIIDDLKEDVPLERQGEMKEARDRLSTIVKQKARNTSDRLRG